MALHGDKDSAPPHTIGERAHKGLERAKTAFELSGVGMPGIDTVLVLWRKVGLKRLFLIALLLGIPAGDYSLLRWAVYSGIPRTIGSFGVTFEAEEWSLRPLSMTAVAHNVRVTAPHEQAPVFTAGEVKFTGSFMTFLKGLPDMLTFHLFGWSQPFNEIEIRNGEIRVERSVTGAVNWASFMDAVPHRAQQDALEGVYQVHAITLQNFQVTYREHIAGGSSNGVIRTAQSEVNVDRIEGSIVDLVRPESNDERPTRVKISGRSSGGTFHLEGTAAVFRPEGEDDQDGAVLRVANRGVNTMIVSNDDVPFFNVTIVLDNIGAAAYGKMVPVTALVPVDGWINGTTKVVRQERRPLDCEGFFTIRDVKFGPNPAVLTDPVQQEVWRRSLMNVAPASGEFDVCGRTRPGQVLQVSTSGAPAADLLTSFNQQATRGAPAGVRALIARDQRVLAGQSAEASLDQLTKGIADQLGLKLSRSLGGGIAGNAAGGALRASLVGPGATGQPAQGPAQNPLAKGVKSVGSGIKRLFGGGDGKK